MPGTLACVVRDNGTGRRLFLSAGHVLFDRGTGEGDPVWTTADFVAGRCDRPFGFTRWGKVGIVCHNDRDAFIDCAVGTLVDDVPVSPIAAGPAPRPADAVFKVGQGSGETRGIVIAIDHLVEQVVHGRPFTAPGQILVEPAVAGAPFLAAADSGALLCNGAGQAIGLLWGVNSRGEGLACPLGAVIAALGITLEADWLRTPLWECA
jgi:hypothetical protein